MRTQAAATKRPPRRVDARAAARRLVKVFALDRGRKAPTLVKATGPLKKLERERLRQRLDEALVFVREDGERVGICALVKQVRVEALTEVATRSGDLPSLVLPPGAIVAVSGEAGAELRGEVGARGMSPVVAEALERIKQRWLAKHPEARGHIAGGRPRKRALHDTLLRIVEVVEDRAAKQAMRAVVLLLFVLGAERDVFGEPRDGDDAASYLARAAKSLQRIVREADYERAGKNDRRARRR